MALRVVRLGTPRAKGEGPRLGTVRRPPRGVKKTDYARRDFYDVWVPELSPSPATIKLAGKNWASFSKAYLREMAKPEATRLLEILARLSHAGDFSVGCYCEDESRCHRSILRKLLLEHGARIDR
jgi:uncharacterized protein YeaO (DUF488 family)